MRGIDEPLELVRVLHATACQQRHQDDRWEALHDALLAHRDEALAFAVRALARHHSPLERERQKDEESRRAMLRRMRGRPTTSKQADFIRRLGWDGDIPLDRRDASELIRRLLERRS